MLRSLIVSTGAGETILEWIEIAALAIELLAVAIIVVGVLWTVDVVSRIVTGSHLIGGTEYMWEPRWPLFTRLLSLYHVILPVLLVVILRRIGYDRRGYLLQSGIAIVAIAIGRLFGPEANINHSYVEPVTKNTWGGAVTHVAVVAAALVGVVYPLTHLLLVKLCPREGTASPAGRGSGDRPRRPGPPR